MVIHYHKLTYTYLQITFKHKNFYPSIINPKNPISQNLETEITFMNKID